MFFASLEMHSLSALLASLASMSCVVGDDTGGGGLLVLFSSCCGCRFSFIVYDVTLMEEEVGLSLVPAIFVGGRVTGGDPHRRGC